MQQHEFDIVSFATGVIFTGLGVAYLFTDAGLGALRGRWVWPAVFLVIGSALIASTLKWSRNSR